VAGPSSSPSVTLRQAEEADLTGALGLLRDADLPQEGVVEGWPRFLLAEEEDRLVGVAGLELYPPVALLRSVVGSKLVWAQLERAKALGVERVYLLTVDAAAFFVRFGFVGLPWDEVDQAARGSVEFRGACPDTVQAMTLGLKQAE